VDIELAMDVGDHHEDKDGTHDHKRRPPKAMTEPIASRTLLGIFLLAAPFVVLVIGQLFGLNPLAILTSIAGMLRLVSVREYGVLADQLILQVSHATCPGALTMIFRARSQMLTIFACHVFDP